MLNIQVNEVNEVKDGKCFKVDIKAEGSASKIAQELHEVNKAIIGLVPEVAEIICKLASED